MATQITRAKINIFAHVAECVADRFLRITDRLGSLVKCFKSFACEYGQRKEIKCHRWVLEPNIAFFPEKHHRVSVQLPSIQVLSKWRAVVCFFGIEVLDAEHDRFRKCFIQLREDQTDGLIEFLNVLAHQYLISLQYEGELTKPTGAEETARRWHRRGVRVERVRVCQRIGKEER